MKKIYLAGFDVFYPDAKQRGRWMKEQCAVHGVEGLYPLDNEADSVEEIFRGNLELIDGCDAVAANLNAFRGAEPDSGTAFEVGYAYAVGKPVFVYREDQRTMREVFGACDADGFAVENFQMPVNLMLGCAAQMIEKDFAGCIEKICEYFGKKG